MNSEISSTSHMANSGHIIWPEVATHNGQQWPLPNTRYTYKIDEQESPLSRGRLAATPVTDSNLVKSVGFSEIERGLVFADVARRLERQLSFALVELAKAHGVVGTMRKESSRVPCLDRMHEDFQHPTNGGAYEM